VKPILLTKTTPWCRAASEFFLALRPDAMVFAGENGDPMPEALREASMIVSFLSPWIVPASALEACAGPAVNFHPAPPEYPGIGCYNFALYDAAPLYGATCHHMSPVPDTGRLVAVRRFPMYPVDTVSLLKERTMVHLLALFYEIAALLAQDAPLPECPETWARKPYLRRELDELGRVTPDMHPDEIRRRVAAMRFPGAPGAFLELAGVRFEAAG